MTGFSGTTYISYILDDDTLLAMIQLQKLMQ